MTSRPPRFGSTIVRFVASAGAVVVIVVVVPWLLVAAARRRFGGAAPWHGVPPPSVWEWQRVRSAFADQLTDDTLADVLVRVALAAAWAAVVVLVVTVVVETAHMTRHGGLAMPDVRGLGLAQPLARTIAAGLLVVVPTLGTAHGVLARAAPTAPPISSSSAELGPAPASDAPSGRDVVDGSRHVVRAGESVYAIAERYVGPDHDAIISFADRVLELNLGRRMPDGEVFDNPALIDVGWVLEIPPRSTVAPSNDAPVAGVHVVERGETLWSIANDELGDPDRWPEVYAANAGRSFDDGGRLDDPSLIRPGWDLVLPGSAVSAGSDSAELPAEPETTEVADTAPPPGAVAPGEDDLPATARSTIPGHPDSQPSVQVDARPTNRWTPTPPASPGSAPSDPAPSDAVIDTSQLSRESGPELLTLGRAAMLSAGVLTLVGVRRRNRLRAARPRATLPVPPVGVANTERTLRSIDVGERFARVDVAVRAAARFLVEADERVAAIIVDEAGAIELRTTGPAALGPPWTCPGEPDRWCLAASAPIEMLADDARRVGSPCPALVQLGRTTDDRDFYVDLEAIGAIDVGGPGELADAIVTAIAATLASSVLAEVTTLVAVGVDDAAFLGHRHHRPARDPADAFRIAAAAAGPMPRGDRSTFELRSLGTGGEAWEPAVVLVGAAAGTVPLPPDRFAVAVVSASPIVGPSGRLEPDGDAWVLRPIGVRFVPVGLGAADLSAMSTLVAAADAEPLEELSIDGVPDPDLGGLASFDDDITLAPSSDDLAAEALPLAATGAATGAAPTLLVRLLGPVDVEASDGRTADFERSKAKELVAWLATHRERSTRTAARTALWELDVRDATFANVVSEARRSLARLIEPPEGEEWVGRTLTEALPLHASVRTDAEVVRVALTQARLQPPAQAIRTLRPAVELVVGMPFEGTTYLWPESEGIASELVLLATSAAAELAAHHLSMGDIDGVFEATGRGLRVLPGHEELIGLRMRAHARRGDRSAVRLEWEQYERVITADPWSDGEPSEALVELRRELLAG